MEFKQFNKLMHKTINRVAEKYQLFHTDIDAWDIYINSFSNKGGELAEKFHADGMIPYKVGSVRQEHNGYYDKRFLDRYGNIAYINEDGVVTSALFSLNDTDGLGVYEKFVSKINKKIKKSSITSFFNQSGITNLVVGNELRLVVGTEFRGGFDHFYTSFKLADNSKSSDGIEQLSMAKVWAGKFKKETVNTALNIASDLDRQDKFINNLKWFAEFQELLLSKATGNNDLWNSLASVPLPYAHIKSGVIGSLLADIQDGLDLTVVVDRFNSKMDPMKYMRQQAEIKEGQIAAARKYLSENGYMESFERDFASVADLDKYGLITWKPEVKDSNTDFFSKLDKKDPAQNTGVTKDIRIQKFIDEILPKAQGISVVVGTSKRYQFTTCVNKDAKNIFKWDHPICGFYYNHSEGHGFNSASKWGLTNGQHAKVIGVTTKPSTNDLMFLINANSPNLDDGNVIFPETLHHSLHAYRKTIEAASNANKGSGDVDGIRAIAACGKGAVVNVTIDGIVKSYKLIDLD